MKADKRNNLIVNVRHGLKHSIAHYDANINTFIKTVYKTWPSVDRRERAREEGHSGMKSRRGKIRQGHTNKASP